ATQISTRSLHDALPIYQIGIYLFHVLGYQPKLRDAFGVKLLLVAKGDWFERVNRFARLVHRLDVLLKTGRGAFRAQVTCGIYNRSEEHTSELQSLAYLV